MNINCGKWRKTERKWEGNGKEIGEMGRKWKGNRGNGKEMGEMSVQIFPCGLPLVHS